MAFKCTPPQPSNLLLLISLPCAPFQKANEMKTKKSSTYTELLDARLNAQGCQLI